MSYQLTPLFSNMRASEHAESIYYADLFRINGQVWALTGTGKSDAGRAATEGRRHNDLARDSVAFVRHGATLLGRFDPGAINVGLTDTLHALHRLAAVVYCCSAAETSKLFRDQPLKLVDIDAELLGAFLSDTPYTGYLAQHFLNDEQLSRLYDPMRKLLHWKQLTRGITGVRWLLAPWMPTASDKGSLYASFVF